MNISKSTYELLLPIIAAIDKSITTDLVEELVVASPGVTGKYKIYSCNTKWATVGFNITINDVVYKIVELDPNVSLTITGSSLPLSGSFDLYAPKFSHGSIKVAEGDLNKKVDGSLSTLLKMPLIWLHEPVDERISLDEENPIYRYSPCDIYFLVDANFANWEQNDHYSQAIKPVRQLIDCFIEAMMKSGLINDNVLEDINMMDLPRFGRYTTDNGAEKAIFSNDMSGTKLKIEIPFIRNSKNCC